MFNRFGWSYPAGAENDPKAPWNLPDPVCDDCGEYEGDCQCIPCDTCHELGRDLLHGLCEDCQDDE